jgi:hypothetical protein
MTGDERLRELRLEQVKTVPTKSIETTYLNMNELKVIYNLLDSHYINYENVDAINLIRKIRNLIGEDV